MEVWRVERAVFMSPALQLANPARQPTQRPSTARRPVHARRASQRPSVPTTSTVVQHIESDKQIPKILFDKWREFQRLLVFFLRGCKL